MHIERTTPTCDCKRNSLPVIQLTVLALLINIIKFSENQYFMTIKMKKQ